jgi:GAF domain-containing protein
MLSPRPTAREAERLLALRQSGLLESGSDLRLDAIVHRAAMLFNMPIAAISLLDDTRQVFKSSLGLGIPYTSRDLAFCSHTIAGPEPLLVMDAQADGRFADNALVRGEPGLRFYVGAPVYGPRGLPFGALCVMDTRRAASVQPEQVAALRALAAEVTELFARPDPINLKLERPW